jgi:pentafunctional AROM polypeptide
LNEYDSHELALLVCDHRVNHKKPLIVVTTGTHSQFARAVALISFATHPPVPSTAATGQLTLWQTHQVQHLIGQIPKRNFIIFGNNIAHALSPTLHNTAFEELGLPHHYRIYETIAVDDGVLGIIARPDFGGAFVIFLHKL